MTSVPTTSEKVNFMSIAPYILPLALFMIIPKIMDSLHLPYEIGYPIGTAIIIAVEMTLWKLGYFPELKLDFKSFLISIPLGLALCTMWFVVDHFTPHFAFLGDRKAYDPFLHIKDQSALMGFLTIRFLGLVIAAPFAEELFYRSFLLRVIINPDHFKSVEIGKYEISSCIAAVVLMAFSHPEWLAAAIFSTSMNVLVYRIKNIAACFFTHAATNLFLGIYVIYSHNWTYW